MDSVAAQALLEWQIELGATEAIGDTPVNRYDAPAKLPKAKTPSADPDPAPVEAVDPVAVARGLAKAAQSLDELRDAMAAFQHCELRRGARNLVFADGEPSARVMIVGEAPGRDEDIEGRPFVGQAGQLLDRMFDAIGMDRTSPDPAKSIYITNILPWRPPQNRDPEPAEMAMMMPFVERHIALADPDILVLMGNISCQALLGRKGITRLRGSWTEAQGRPVLPMFHPAYLLRNPAAKRDAWHDLLTLQKRLRES
ncbi:MAG: uracil-DNA glycosylase [Rhodobacteraceae bacterium]|nr:uracil-DNA glycosylase [Paracoccaceae bacterium]